MGVKIGIAGKARAVKGLYFGVGGKARKVTKAYIGDANGKAKLWWQLGQTVPMTTITFAFKWIDTDGNSFTDALGQDYTARAYVDGTLVVALPSAANNYQATAKADLPSGSTYNDVRILSSADFTPPYISMIKSVTYTDGGVEKTANNINLALTHGNPLIIAGVSGVLVEDASKNRVTITCVVAKA